MEKLRQAIAEASIGMEKSEKLRESILDMPGDTCLLQEATTDQENKETAKEEEEIPNAPLQSSSGNDGK